MTLEEKLKEVKETHPEIYAILEAEVPDLIEHPDNPKVEELDNYNFWIDAILDEDYAQQLYEI
jgi:hypothetical protein